ncbi:MAG: SpoIVB peptidase S55 [Acidobacteria bacterium]|nr:SpoIVB peptidase S55 [Acidobacteriota bacterium]MBW4044189.1 SpoIVB peptidase S55 [Acidobacteriota bacterium]
MKAISKIAACFSLAVTIPATMPAQTQMAATPPPSTAGVFPVSAIHRGMHGVAYTVFEGTQPEPMDVEILGLLHNALGPGQDMILARLHGAKPEYTGVVAGMSGSPVYIDGKLAGALAYRIGEFSKEPIAGITPIEQMLQVRDMQKTVPMEMAATSTGSETGPIRPIETPLVFDGFSAAAVELWNKHTPGLGLTAVAGLGGGGGSQHQPEPIIPGSAVSALLVRGDLEISATCTATYVDAKKLLACGHPITQFGPVSLPMTKAEVLATLPSPYNAFKIVNTTDTVGSFTEDRQTAIAGRFGVAARMIPVTLHITGAGTPRELHLEVVDQPQITPSAVMVSVFQGLMESNNYTAETSYRVRSTISMEGYQPVALDEMVAPTELGPANMIAALMVGSDFSRLYDNAARRTPIRSVDVTIEAVPKRLTAELESAVSTTTTMHAGDTVTIEATLRPYHGEVRNVRIPVKLPATLPDGPVRLLISNGAALDRLLQPPQAGGQQLDVSQTIAQLNSQHPNDRLYVTLLAPSAQATVEGRTLPTLPISMANALEPLKQNHKLTLSGESAVPLASVGVDAMLSGEQVLNLMVE